MSTQTIDLTDFTISPGGRFREQGDFSGEQFRDEVLLPALEKHDRVILNLNGALGLPASFLDEAIGKLAELLADFDRRVGIVLDDNSTALLVLKESIAEHTKARR